MYARYATLLALGVPLVARGLLVAGGRRRLDPAPDVSPRGQTLDFAEACYGIFLLIFVEGFLEFPEEWYLQIAFFLVPIVGLGAVADSLVRLGYLVFTRKGNLPEWHRMVASVYRDHVIVVGLGTVGYQIVKELLQLRELVAVIERPHVESELIEEMLDRDVPIVRGDARSAKTLEAAGVRRAKAVILATQDDLANLDAALTARDLNPKAKIVLRMFDESLAEKVGGSFALPAVSTAKVAAPAFVAAATGQEGLPGLPARRPPRPPRRPDDLPRRRPRRPHRRRDPGRPPGQHRHAPRRAAAPTSTPTTTSSSAPATRSSPSRRSTASSTSSG